MSETPQETPGVVHQNEDPFPVIWDDDIPEGVDPESLGDDSDPIEEAK